MSDKAPLSPHLQVYRLPATALASICHRASGVVLALVLVVDVPVCLLMLAYAPDAFDEMVSLFQSIWFLPVQFFLVLVIVYHLLSGVRHLLMDLGIWLEKRSSLLSAYGLFATALVVSTAIFFI